MQKNKNFSNFWKSGTNQRIKGINFVTITMQTEQMANLRNRWRNILQSWIFSWFYDFMIFTILETQATIKEGMCHKCFLRSIPKLFLEKLFFSHYLKCVFWYSCRLYWDTECHFFWGEAGAGEGGGRVWRGAFQWSPCLFRSQFYSSFKKHLLWKFQTENIPGTCQFIASFSE